VGTQYLPGYHSLGPLLQTTGMYAFYPSILNLVENIDFTNNLTNKDLVCLIKINRFNEYTEYFGQNTFQTLLNILFPDSKCFKYYILYTIFA